MYKYFLLAVVSFCFFVVGNPFVVEAFHGGGGGGRMGGERGFDNRGMNQEFQHDFNREFRDQDQINRDLRNLDYGGGYGGYNYALPQYNYDAFPDEMQPSPSLYQEQTQGLPPTSDQVQELQE